MSRMPGSRFFRRRRAPSRPRKLNNINYNIKKAVQRMGLNGTALNCNEAIGLETGITELNLIDVGKEELTRRLDDYEYCRLDGVAVTAYPSSSENQIRVRMDWVNTPRGSLIFDDSTKLVLHPSFRPYTYMFMPPKVVTRHYTSDVATLIPSFWTVCSDIKTAVTQDNFPCKLYFQNMGLQGPKFEITVKWSFRRSLTVSSSRIVKMSEVKRYKPLSTNSDEKDSLLPAAS